MKTTGSLSFSRRKTLRALLEQPICPGSESASDPPLSHFLARTAQYALSYLRLGLERTGFATAPRLPDFSLPDTFEGNVLIVVPPFASLWYPSLAAHLLQACARDRGFAVDVLYANSLLASFVGEPYYEQIAAESTAMLGERFFARAAFQLPPLGYGASEMFDLRRMYGESHGDLYRGLVPDGEAATLGRAKRLNVATIRRLESGVPAFLDLLASQIVARGYRIVGSTTTFEQTCASIALLNRIKALDPNIVTILGGANCEGEMAEGLLSTGARIDYIFSGESEKTFPEFLGALFGGALPQEKIIVGQPCSDMDAIPYLSFREFFLQRELFLPNSTSPSATYLSYETSRGCWWGQKQHCTFCGLNGEGMAYRRKSPERVLSELRALLDESPTRKLVMTDNIMPHEYLRTLLPRLSRELPAVQIFYEQKSNLSWADVQTLRSAGVNAIQPGIEALSTQLLKVMRKGVQSRQNLMLLRYGRIAGIQLIWNLICGFPGDELAAYKETLDLVRLIPHLPPPSGLWYLSIDRFSPYHVQPDAFGIKNVRPISSYRDIFPETSAFSRIAYHFVGDYDSGTRANIEFVRALSVEVRSWHRRANSRGPDRPELKICRRDDALMLVDTRRLRETEPLQQINEEEARLLLSAHPYRRSQAENDAVGRKLAVVLDNWFIPLPVARQELFTEFSKEAQTIREHSIDDNRAQIVGLSGIGRAASGQNTPRGPRQPENAWVYNPVEEKSKWNTG
jgi:ribosomal peptide maturation radical SAM protein 1